MGKSKADKKFKTPSSPDAAKYPKSKVRAKDSDGPKQSKRSDAPAKPADYLFLHVLIVAVGVVMPCSIYLVRQAQQHELVQQATILHAPMSDGGRKTQSSQSHQGRPIHSGPLTSSERKSRQAKLDSVFNDAVKAWGGTLIDHVPYKKLSYDRFFSDYQAKRRPVVITGMYADSPLTEGNLYVAFICFHFYLCSDYKFYYFFLISIFIKPKVMTKKIGAGLG